MKNLVMGIDADGVLVNVHDFYLREGEKFFRKKPTTLQSYEPKDIFKVSKYKELLFGLCVFTKYCKAEKAYENCSETIQRAANEGEQINIISARKMTTQKNIVGKFYRHLLNKWLKNNNIPTHSVQFCSEKYVLRDKLFACRKLAVDIMIEDSPQVATHLAENNIKVLLFDAPYNKDTRHNNIVRVHNWQEINDQIQKHKALKSLNCEQNANVDRLKPEICKNYIKKFKVMYLATFVPFSLMYHAKAIGKENIPFQDGFIIASNHLDGRDQYYISRALGNKVFCGLAASTIQNTMRGRLANITGNAIFVDRNNPQSRKDAKNQLICRISSGVSALIFPEGTRKNKDNANTSLLQLPFKLGAVSIAQKTKTAILPISIFHKKNKHCVRIGQLMYVSPLENLQCANKKLEDTVLNMTLESMKKA